jgi:hypothetical protein
VQCSAISKRSGKQCRGPAIDGATVCRLHGGSAPQVKKAAARRLATQTALQWATQELESAGLPDRTPLEHLEAVLEEDARAFALWDLACETLVVEGSTLLGKNKHGEELIHPYVVERNQAAQRWARTSKYALDAGVSERRVQIEQDRANLIATAMRATLAALGLSAEVQQQGLSILGQKLRQLGPGD